MTDSANVVTTTKKHNEPTTYDSDAGHNESMGNSDVTTDDEFYDELMDAPAEIQDCLIPDKCQDETQGIEHLAKCLSRRFQAYPAFFTGTLQDALKAALSPKTISERWPLLIYVNNDKSIYTNLFCKQLLCNHKIIEYLMSSYVLWGWDITFESNEKKLNEIFTKVFAQWAKEQPFDTNAVEQYPLLMGIYRNTNGDHVFERLIEGSSKRLSLDEFLAVLIQFKDKFDMSEGYLEKTREQTKREILYQLFHNRDLNYPSSHHPRNRDLLRSTSMLSTMDCEPRRCHPHLPYRRLLSGHHCTETAYEELLSHHRRDDHDMASQFERIHVESDDGDDEDDEPTPTVERPQPKFL